MNDDKLTEFLARELEYIMSESNKRGTSDGEKAFERVGNKAKMLTDVLSCRALSATEIAATDLSFGTKKIALELFDNDALISQIIQAKQ
jgi:hypothetical protein